MEMKKSALLILFAILIAGITLFAFWCGKQACMMMSETGPTYKQTLYGDLNLNAEQKQTLKQMDDSFQKEADAICKKICMEKVNLMNLMADKKSSRDSIYRKIEEIGGIQTSLEKKIADHIQEVKTNLTAEQSEAYTKRLNQEFQQSIEQCGYGKILK